MQNELLPVRRNTVRSLIFAGASLSALAIAAPAQAECAVAGSTATCSGTQTDNVMVLGANAEIVSTAEVSTTTSAQEGFVTGALYALSVNGPPSTSSARIESNGNISTTGTDASGLLAGVINNLEPFTGNALIESRGNVSTTGAGANGIWAFSSGALTSIDSVGNITTGGAGAVGIIGSSVIQTSLTTVGDVRTTGVGAHGILAGGQNVEVLSEGLVSTTGDEASGIVIGAFETADRKATRIGGVSGNILLSAGDVSTVGRSSTAIDVSSTGGWIEITAENVSASGPSSDGIRAEQLSVEESVSIAVETVSVAGNAAIHANAVGGDIVIEAGAISSIADDAYGIFARSNFGNITIDGGSVVQSGDQPLMFETVPGQPPKLSDTAAIRALASQGNIDIRVDDILASGENGRAIFATGRNVSIAVDGTIEATNGVIADAQAGTLASVLVNGVVHGSGSGVSVLGSSATVEVAEGASVTGGTNAIVVSGGNSSHSFVQVYNNGTVSGEQGAAILGTDFGPGLTYVYIQNNGVLSGGSNGVAVSTGDGDDTLELTELSRITGLIDLGDGDDRLTLDFNDDAAASIIGQVASTINVEGLSVDSGNWRAAGAQSAYEFIEIEQGATLTVAESVNGDLAVVADLVELDGVLRLDLVSDEAEVDFGQTTVVGGGSLHLVGTASVELTNASGLQHTGGTFIENGELLLSTVYGGDITTSGDGVFYLGEVGDFTGNLVNDGTFVFARTDDYSFLGDFTGSGVLEKRGDGLLTFAGFYGFEGTTSILGGAVSFAGQLADNVELDIGAGVVDLSQNPTGQQTVAQLAGTGGAVELGTTQLTINQAGDTVFAGSVSGSGNLIKNGAGDLKLDGDGSGFTGTGQIDGGTLSVNGDFSNASFVVNEGGILGGAGMIGATTINGGVLAPGNSIGTLNVAGDLIFTGASTFTVEVDSAGNADLVVVGREAALGGAAVNVIAQSGTYRAQTDYTILTAAGGIDGEFGPVGTNLAFLDPTLLYSDNAVTLRLVRNTLDFASFAATANQAAIANLIESYAFGNALYDEALTLVSSDVATSLASLTGDVYPAYGAALIETAEVLRRQTAAPARAGNGGYVWATGLYNSVEGGQGRGSLSLTGLGVAGGFGFVSNGLTASAGMGVLDQDRGNSQFGDGEVTFAIGRLGYATDSGFSVSAGLQLGWVDAQTRRQTSLGAINQAVNGQIDGDYVQFFGEVSYRIARGDALQIEPFASVSHVSLDLEPVTEIGAPTALNVGATDRKVTFADVGLRVTADGGSGVRPFASAAYRHAWGDRASLANVGFNGVAGSASIGGLPIARGAAELAAGAVITNGAVDFELGYDGSISSGFDSHGIRTSMRLRF
jgi:fibronectin-binding autotransporter adhesin